MRSFGAQSRALAHRRAPSAASAVSAVEQFLRVFLRSRSGTGLEIRLASFKSFRDAVLPLDAFTLLVGRNGSGKSNALDGLWTLARLASGEDIRLFIEHTLSLGLGLLGTLEMLASFSVLLWHLAGSIVYLSKPLWRESDVTRILSKCKGKLVCGRMAGRQLPY